MMCPSVATDFLMKHNFDLAGHYNCSTPMIREYVEHLTLLDFELILRVQFTVFFS